MGSAGQDVNDQVSHGRRSIAVSRWGIECPVNEEAAHGAPSIAGTQRGGVDHHVRRSMAVSQWVKDYLVLDEIAHGEPSIAGTPERDGECQHGNEVSVDRLEGAYNDCGSPEQSAVGMIV